MRPFNIVSVVVAVSILLLVSGDGDRLYRVLTDLDPILRFSPGPNLKDVTPEHPQDPLSTWNVSDSGIAWNDSSLWNASGTYPFHTRHGSTSHVTSLPGATVSLDWVATHICFWGDFTGNVTFTVDGQNLTIPPALDNISSICRETGTGTVIAQATGLQYTKHTATLTLVSGTLNITGASYAYAEPPNDTDVVTIPLLDSNGNLAQNFYNKSGDEWKADRSSLCDQNGQGCVINSRLWTNTKGASLTTRTPPNSSEVEIQGAVSDKGGTYRVFISPDPPYGVSPFFQTTSMSPILMSFQTLWTATLDPTVIYDIKVSNQEVNSQLDLNLFLYFQNMEAAAAYTNASATSATLSSPSSTGAHSSTSSPHAGAIAGGVVGEVACVILLAVVFWFCVRRRRKEYFPRSNSEKFEVEEWEEAHESPPLSPFTPVSTNSRPDTLANTATFEPACTPKRGAFETKQPDSTNVSHRASGELDASLLQPPRKTLEAAAASPVSPHPSYRRSLATTFPSPTSTHPMSAATLPSPTSTHPMSVTALPSPSPTSTYPMSATTLASPASTPPSSSSTTAPWRQPGDGPTTVVENPEPHHEVDYSYERDAGRLRPVVAVPPSYDPRWADESDEPDEDDEYGEPESAGVGMGRRLA